jgi:Restriction endonuclease EcoRII, N-terminal
MEITKVDPDLPHLRKLLTDNDLGATGSHQAGVHVPKGLAKYFPTLEEAELNPDVWLQVRHVGGTSRWRFIHYNNGVVGSGTRDEFRLTHVTEFLGAAGALAGDTLELTRTGPISYDARVASQDARNDSLVLSVAGGWRVVQLRRLRV